MRMTLVLSLLFFCANSFAMKSPYWRSVDQLEALLGDSDVQNLVGKIQSLKLIPGEDITWELTTSEKCKLVAVLEPQAMNGRIGSPAYEIRDLDVEPSCVATKPDPASGRRPQNSERIRQFLFAVNSQAASDASGSRIVQLIMDKDLTVVVQTQTCRATVELTPKRGVAGSVNYTVRRVGKVVCRYKK